jgi:Spy/CpxP family protein refolding chaperone
MTRKIIFYFLLVFLSGSVVGALAYRTYNPPTARGSAPASPNAWRQRYVDETQSRLSLSDDQVAKLREMLDQTEARFRQARERENQEIRQIGEEHYQRVRTILTPEQLPKYEKLHEEREAKAKEQERNNKR